MILGNVDEPETQQLMENLLPTLHRERVLITTRIQRWRNNVQPEQLDLFTESEALEFLNEPLYPKQAPTRAEEAELKSLT